MFDLDEMGADYELAWPVDVFREEARAILAGPADSFVNHADLLLTEAFVDSVPALEFRKAGFSASWGSPRPSDPWGSHTVSGDGDPKRSYVSELMELADQLPTARTGRPFWAQRHGITLPIPVAPVEDIRFSWLRLAHELIDAGYLSRVSDEPCVDGLSENEIDQNLARQIERRVGVSGLWPLPSAVEDPDNNFLFTVVEVFDELVARPRHRHWHDYASCGWHHSEQVRRPGRSIYRWKVNELLERAGHDLRLAINGEDAGRLIYEVSDPRAELVTEVLQTSDKPAQVSVAHAIALFRKRGATREDKRSACVDLARVLENRKQLVKGELLNKDADLVYSSANNWDIRHSNGNQYTEQGEEFQDWVFWIYLATVELSNRLIDRQAIKGSPTT